MLGDDGTEQKYIRTIHGRGFRFHANVDVIDHTATESDDSLRQAIRDTLPATRYARSGNVHIAYQVFGSGAYDLVLVPGFVSHIDNYWADPHMSAWLHALGRFARVTMFDKRGTGLSDAVSELPGLDVRMDDVRAVMDAVKLKNAFIMGISEGGSLASIFAATHPSRCRGLILYGGFAKFTSWFSTRKELLGLFDYMETAWGSGESVPAFAPSMANDADFKAWWGKFERLGATPGAAITLMNMNSQIDISEIISSIQVPSLVIHRTQDVLIDVEAGRFLADNIPGAHYVELPGTDHLPWVGNNCKEITSVIENFVQGDSDPLVPESILTTIICIEMTDSDDRFTDDTIKDDVNAAMRHRITRYRGNEIVSEAGRTIATFDGPARAIHCAIDILNKLGSFDVSMRAGMHIGEVELSNGRVSGVTVDIARELVTLADENQVIVSRTITDLVAGSGIDFKQHGTHNLDAIDKEWQLYRVNIDRS